MSEPRKQAAASSREALLDATWARLVARHEAIERQLEAALRRTGLARSALIEGAAAQVARVDADQLRAAREQIACASLRLPELSWEQLSRPSLDEISRGRAGRWLRV